MELAVLGFLVLAANKVSDLRNYSVRKIMKTPTKNEPIRVFEPDDVNPRYGSEFYSMEGLTDYLRTVQRADIHTDRERYSHGQYAHPKEETFALTFDWHQPPFFPRLNLISH